MDRSDVWSSSETHWKLIFEKKVQRNNLPKRNSMQLETRFVRFREYWCYRNGFIGILLRFENALAFYLGQERYNYACF